METKLFDEIIFGPIKSRRLGVSLGVNLLPVDGKLCNFNCCYCECGWTLSQKGLRYNDADAVITALEARLLEGEHIDVITFAGNGEPTMHPRFEEIIDRTLTLRDRLSPHTKVAVLSNASMLGKDGVRAALERVDRAMLKIDSAIDHTIELINEPKYNYSLQKVISDMKRFTGELIIQTMLLRGEVNGEKFDNTSEQELKAYLDVVAELKPSLVMLYTIDRPTPSNSLVQLTNAELDVVADKVRELGIECQVSYLR